MKTSVTRIMMSFALMGCLIIGASDASAQGRSRSQGGSSSSRSHSAAVSRSSSSAAPQVSRSSSSSSRSSATPQVSRSSSSSSRSSATPQVGRSSTSSSRSSATPQVGRSGSGSSRSGHSATTRGGDNRGGSGNSGSSGSVTRHSDSKPQVSHQGTTQRVDRSTHNGSETRLGDRDRRGNRPGGNTGNGNHGNGNHGNGNHGNGNHGNGNHGNMGNGNHGNGGNHPEGNRPPSNRPGGHGGHGDNHGHGGHHGYNPDHRFDYSSHHYRDQFSWNHSHHNWSRPLPPPARRYRPAPLIWRRPVIPAGWHPYAGAPIIDRVLGLVFGTLYEVSLDQLYYNGYYIDGYADNVIYLRDVTMLNLYWPDVMLSYEYGKLANAQFVYHSSYYDRTRFNRAYNSLCRIYGSPVYQDGMTISWYGGNSTGWVTLTMTDSYGDYYTTMSIGY